MLLKIEDLYKSYPLKGPGLFSSSRKVIINGLNLSLARGEIVALVGESGSGKSTLARLILGLEKPDRGAICLKGRPVSDPGVRRKHISAVFQDYSTSINPGYSVFEAIAEPLRLEDCPDIEARVAALMDRMKLEPGLKSRRPHELSGGQAQRVCLARAVAVRPALMVLDEALSSLDVPAQVSMLELLDELKVESTAMLFITHDLQSAAYLCARVIFFQAGQVVAESPVGRLAEVDNPYARRLLAAAMPF